MIVLLSSVSLFALVVIGRPVLPSDAEPTDFVPPSSALQTSIQTPFRIDSGKDDLISDAAHFHFAKSKQRIEYLLGLGKETTAITLFQVSPEEPPTFGALSNETLVEQDLLDANSEHDRTDKPAASEPTVEALINGPPPTPIIVLVYSCIAALLALACIGLSLYVMNSLRSHILASKTAWELLPRFWRRSKCQENTTVTEKYLSGTGSLLFLLDVEDGSTQRPELPRGDNLYLDAVSDMEFEWDGVDEKYQDALDMTPLPLTYDLPHEDNVSRPSHYDPPSLHSGSCPLDLPIADRSSPLVCEACSPPSPVSRPAWSVRATDSPALGLSSSQSGIDDATALVQSRRRAYRSPVPEFDVALAMQLRPGLGIGADSAWMVRFLMAIFGWFTVALTGNTR